MGLLGASQNLSICRQLKYRLSPKMKRRYFFQFRNNFRFYWLAGVEYKFELCET